MTTTPATSIKPFREALPFSICYILVFFVMIERFADDVQTKAMFRLTAVLLNIILIACYIIIVRLVVRGHRELPLLKKAIWLYILTELIVFLFSGSPAVFGLYQRIIGSNSEVLDFREQRDFSFSLAAVISSVVFYFWNRLRSRALSPQTPPHA